MISSLFVFTSYQEPQDNDKIYWTTEKKLTWDDFKGIPDSKSKRGAITYSGFDYVVYSKKDTAFIDASSFFHTNTSWVNKKLDVSNLLDHEQTHFDITELYTRKFKKLVSSEKFDRKTIKETLKKTFVKIRQEHAEYQAQFDKETSHATNAEQEKKWEKEIEKTIKKLNDFSQATVKIYLGK